MVSAHGGKIEHLASILATCHVDASSEEHGGRQQGAQKGISAFSWEDRAGCVNYMRLISPCNNEMWFGYLLELSHRASALYYPPDGSSSAKKKKTQENWYTQLYLAEREVMLSAVWTVEVSVTDMRTFQAANPKHPGYMLQRFFDNVYEMPFLRLQRHFDSAAEDPLPAVADDMETQSTTR